LSGPSIWRFSIARIEYQDDLIWLVSTDGLEEWIDRKSNQKHQDSALFVLSWQASWFILVALGTLEFKREQLLSVFGDSLWIKRIRKLTPVTLRSSLCSKSKVIFNWHFRLLWKKTDSSHLFFISRSSHKL
jgi:hypothetical protein